jgi:signal transduction histidine kinase/tetratricopeptide (TPR) repeat protein
VADGTKKPAFIGQALLLLVPVIVLLVIGLNSLRQDKIQAHREAAERGQQLADTLATRGVAMFIPPKSDPPPTGVYVFQVDASGGLLFPPPIATLTPRPLHFADLSPEQSELWRSAQELEAQSNGVTQAIAAYTKFLALNPPPGFSANAIYSLGLLHGARGDLPEAADAFRKLAEDQPDALTESGMPLKPLVLLKLLELQSRVPDTERAPSLDAACSNVVYQPTPLTRALLRQAGQLARASGGDSVFNRWMELWSEHERTRSLYAAAALHSITDAALFRPGESMNHPEPLPTGTNGRAEMTIEAPESDKGNTSKGGSKLSAAMVANAAFWFRDDAGNAKGKLAAGQNSKVSQNWLAVPYQKSSTGSWLACWSETQAQAFAHAMMEQVGPVADYLAVEIRLAGKTMVAPVAQNLNAAIGQTEKSEELLGVASRPDAGNGWMEAKVYLTQPAFLYRHQRARRFWFGALIASCAVAALVGLVANWYAFKRQQRLSELKSNFVSSVSHELRTPVASVQLLVEGLESGRVSGAAKQKEYLHLMGQECRRLSGLIDNILDFSRIDDGRKQFEFSATDVNALTSETVKMIEPYAGERKVSLALTTAGTSPVKPIAPILDGLAIRQALLNLIDNAIKHSPEGNTVTVGVEWTSNNTAEKSHVLISVEDNGAGIPPEEHEKIFERFYRRGSELNRETQGIGIGLTIVKHIVESHGGRVLVRSAVGQGSRFTMELPLNRKEETTA